MEHHLKILSSTGHIFVHPPSLNATHTLPPFHPLFHASTYPPSLPPSIPTTLPPSIPIPFLPPYLYLESLNLVFFYFLILSYLIKLAKLVAILNRNLPSPFHYKLDQMLLRHQENTGVHALVFQWNSFGEKIHVCPTVIFKIFPILICFHICFNLVSKMYSVTLDTKLACVFGLKLSSLFIYSFVGNKITVFE